MVVITPEAEQGRKEEEKINRSEIEGMGDVQRNVNIQAARQKAWQGQSLMMKGDYEGAVKAFNEALDLDPNYEHARVKRAEAYRHLGMN